MVSVIRNTTWWVLLGGLAFGLGGCAKEPENVAWPKVEWKGQQDEVLLRSSYEVLLKGKKVGYMLLDAKLDAKAQEVYGIWFTAMEYKRGNDIVSNLLDVHFVETTEGVLKSIRVDGNSSPTEQPASTLATVAGDTLEARVETAESESDSRKPWPQDVLGPLAIDLSLIRQPMKPGETRSFSNVEPNSLSVYQQNLTAFDYEDYQGQSLLKISVVSTQGDLSMEGNLWVNQDGVIVRATYPQMGMEVVLTERMKATLLDKNANGMELDLNEETSVEIQGIYNQEADTQFLILTSTLTDLNGLFSPSTHQQIKKSSENEVVIVTRDVPQTVTAEQEDLLKTYLGSSLLIQAEHQAIQDQVQSLVEKLENDQEKLKAIHTFVSQHMVKKNYSKAMASALDAFQSQEGDCTEHACLFAAMARAAGIPTRMAAGLVAIPEDASARVWYHMWNESYLNGQWVSIDATRTPGEEKWSRYIKISDTALSNEDDRQYALKALLLLGDLQVYSKQG